MVGLGLHVLSYCVGGIAGCTLQSGLPINPTAFTGTASASYYIQVT